MQQHRGADPHRQAGHGGDHGLLAGDKRAHEGDGRRLAVRCVEHEVLEIVSRGEDAGLSGEEQRTHRGIRTRVKHGLREHRVHLARDRVLLLRPREADDGDLVLDSCFDFHAVFS